jgi:hypothetical protein
MHRNDEHIPDELRHVAEALDALSRRERLSAPPDLESRLFDASVMGLARRPATPPRRAESAPIYRIFSSRTAGLRMAAAVAVVASILAVWAAGIRPGMPASPAPAWDQWLAADDLELILLTSGVLGWPFSDEISHLNRETEHTATRLDEDWLSGLLLLNEDPM